MSTTLIPEIDDPGRDYGDKVMAVEPGGAEFIPLNERHGKPRQLLWTWTSPNMEFATIGVGILGPLYFGLNFWQSVLAIVIGFALMGANYATSKPEDRPHLDLRHATWLAPYLLGVAVVSYLSSFDTSTKGGPFGLLIGPTNTLHFGWDVLAMAVVSVVVYFLAMHQRLPDDAVQVYIEEVTAEAEEEEREVVTAAG